MQKKITTLTGTIIIIIAAVILLGGVYVFQFFALQKINKILQVPNKPVSQKQQILNKPFPLAGESTTK